MSRRYERLLVPCRAFRRSYNSGDDHDPAICRNAAFLDDHISAASWGALKRTMLFSLSPAYGGEGWGEGHRSRESLSLASLAFRILPARTMVLNICMNGLEAASLAPHPNPLPARGEREQLHNFVGAPEDATMPDALSDPTAAP